MKNFPFLLCILDGLGLNPDSRANAVAAAKKPHLDRLLAHFPNTTLITHGERVGLPAGQMGNSEVGHLNIGAGRVVEQWLLRISRALSGSYLDRSAPYQSFLKSVGSSSRIHVCGLWSDGGVHSHSEHLALLLTRLHQDFEGDILLHLFSDGRDTSPFRLEEQRLELESLLAKLPRCHIATVTGRFYAMDRDKRWERTKKAYDALVNGLGEPCHSLKELAAARYAAGVTDEFFEPAIFPDHVFDCRDGMLFFNFREDRMRQLVRCLCMPDFSDFERSVRALSPQHTLCFTDYDHSFGLPVLFDNISIAHHLGEVLSDAGISQLRVAETEKYPHVTYFLNGGVEKPLPGEDRQMVPSPRDVKTYDLKPEMSAYGVTEIVQRAIASQSHQVIIVNLANCDMVGHTGVFEAAVKAVETVDSCLGTMLTALEKAQGQALIIADHGNAEQLVNYEDGTPHTSHTTYPVPCIAIPAQAGFTLRDGGALCDVAPTILKMLQLPQPKEMTGRALF